MNIYRNDLDQSCRYSEWRKTGPFIRPDLPMVPPSINPVSRPIVQLLGLDLIYDRELEDSYNILWGNKSYTFAPPDAAHSHSFLHFFTPDAATIKQFPGRISCTMMEVKHGNGSIVFFRHRNWATCSNFGDLRTILEQMNSDTTNIRYMRVNIAQGDCFVIPPGTQYVIHPSSNIILAACNFFHRCNLQQSYGLNEIQFQLPGDRDTLKKYWLQVCKDIANNAPPSLSKLHEIMQNNLEQGEIILFSGKGWLHPFL